MNSRMTRYGTALAIGILCLQVLVSFGLWPVESRVVGYASSSDAAFLGSKFSCRNDYWMQVNANGFGIQSNQYALSIQAFKNDLYVGTASNQPEHMAEIWRSEDRLVWVQVMTDGFGESNQGIVSMADFKGHIYTGTQNYASGCQIWRSQTGNSGDWDKVVTNGFSDDAGIAIVYLMHEFKGNLYAGTGGGVGHPMNLWRTRDGVEWLPVTTDGFGNVHNIRLTSMCTFKGYLYIGTSNEVEGGEVWRSQTGEPGSWERVASGGLGNPDSIYLYESTVFKGCLYMTIAVRLGAGEIWRTADGVNWDRVAAGGFEDLDNNEIRHLIVFEGEIYAGTRTYDGCEMWKSKDGTTWAKSNQKGFGDAHNRYVTSTGVFKGDLYVGTWNQADGCEIWRLDMPCHRS